MTAEESVRTLGIYVDQKSNKRPMPEMHDHGFFEIYFVLKGDREYFIGDRFFKVSAGDTVLIPPNTLHRTVSGIVHRILVHIDSAYLSRFFSQEMIESLSCLGGVAVLRPASENATRTLSIYQSLLECFNQHAARYKIVTHKHGGYAVEYVIAGFFDVVGYHVFKGEHAELIERTCTRNEV